MIEIIYIINIFNSNSYNRSLFISSEKYRKSSIRKNCKFFIREHAHFKLPVVNL